LKVIAGIFYFNHLEKTPVCRKRKFSWLKFLALPV